ncbi:cation:proton antiporter [Pelagibius litoralis]|uniref:Cation:proton antiporter n=1 Tax=Pelagibius litoralis TaxID=374515 RepID=A0A967EUK6_9PROT|nr:cation:proton antiporter [Pelagibius litoralis]NIA67142.1 cation:proton antiporter [Pelagibius litoralis]
MLLVLSQLLCLLVIARLCGVGAERLGQAAPVGELVAGVLIAVAVSVIGPILGGAANGLLVDLREAPQIADIATMAIFFLVLRAGVDMEPREMFAASGGAFAVALGGVIVPMALGIGLAWWFIPASEMKVAQALVVGVAMSVTAIPATARVFEELGLLHSRLGITVMAAALIDDVFGLILLAGVTTYAATGGDADLGNLAWLAAKACLFFTVTGLLGAHVYPHVNERLREEKIVALDLSALVAVAIAYALLAEVLGLHWIMGAFMAGLFLEPARIGQRAFDDMKLILAAITSGVLGPLFFVSIGMQVDLGAVYEAPALAALVILAAFFGKLMGSGLPALWIGFDRRHAAAVGVGMSARGAVELIILGVVAEAGILATGGRAGEAGVVDNLFSLLVVMAVVTTFIAPLALRWLLKADE